MQNFIRSERGYDTGHKLPAAILKYGLILLIANEIRGLVVVGLIVREFWL